MTTEQLDPAYRAFSRRRSFRTFLIEFVSGNQLPIAHPEAIRNEGNFYVMRCPDGGYVAFTPESVCRLLNRTQPQA